MQKLVISPKKQFLVKRFSQVNLAKNRNASALKSSDIKKGSQVPTKNNQMLLPLKVLISKRAAKFFNDSFHLKCRFSTKYIKTWPLFFIFYLFIYLFIFFLIIVITDESFKIRVNSLKKWTELLWVSRRLLISCLLFTCLNFDFFSNILELGNESLTMKKIMCTPREIHCKSNFCQSKYELQ